MSIDINYYFNICYPDNDSISDGEDLWYLWGKNTYYVEAKFGKKILARFQTTFRDEIFIGNGCDIIQIIIQDNQVILARLFPNRIPFIVESFNCKTKLEKLYGKMESTNCEIWYSLCFISTRIK